MKFAVFLALCATSYAANRPFYPSGSTASLKCDEAKFDPAGASASGSPANASVCSSNCLSDKLNSNAAINDTTDRVIGLVADRYAGCSFPAEYTVAEKAGWPCPYTTMEMGFTGYFIEISDDMMLTNETIISVMMHVNMTSVDPDATPWMIYKGDRDEINSHTCSDAHEWWFSGDPVPASVSGDVSNYQVNLTDYYHLYYVNYYGANIFAVPGGSAVLNENSPDTAATTLSKGPIQVGSSPDCGAITNCTSCVKSCNWCQLPVPSGYTNGWCGVTESQCYGQKSPFGPAEWYRDQCFTPEPTTTSTTTTTTTTTTSNTGNTASTAVTTRAAGASSAMMLSVAGAVLLGAALSL